MCVCVRVCTVCGVCVHVCAFTQCVCALCVLRVHVVRACVFVVSRYVCSVCVRETTHHDGVVGVADVERDSSDPQPLREAYARREDDLVSERRGAVLRDVRHRPHRQLRSTRSSAQGNCSAKSLAGNIIDSSLSFLSSTSYAVHGVVMGGSGGSGWGEGGWERRVEGRGQGTFHPPCHIRHYHMVLRPKGTSHSQDLLSGHQW